ncbi:MAG: ATP-binding protein [Aggregatilineales bacterium]
MVSSALWSRLYPRINARITLPFLLVIIVVAAIGTVVITSSVAGNIQERLANQLADSVQTAVNTVADIERQQLSTLRSMTFTEGVSDSILSGDASAIELLLLPIAANNRVNDLIVFGTDGQTSYRILSESNGNYVPGPLLDLSSWTIVQNILSGEPDQFGDKFAEFHGEGTDRTLYFGAAFVDNAGTVVGGVMVGVRGTTLIRLLVEQSISNVTLYDDDGNVTDTSFRGQNEDLLALTPLRVAEIKSDVETLQIDSEVNVGGTPYQFMYSPFQLRGEQVGVMSSALPVDFVAGRVSKSRNDFFGIFGGMVLAVAVLGVFISRSIVRPVFRMVETTRAIESGDLSKRVRLQMPDELGELGRSFDHMTDRLLDQNQEIRDLFNLQLQETARRDAVLGSISDAVVVLDNEGNTILSNETARELINRLQADPAPPIPPDFSMLRRQSDPYTITAYDNHYSVLSRPVNLDTGAILGYVQVLRDITAIVESDRLKDEIILQLSHELRTPLTSARGYADLLVHMAAARLTAQDQDFLVKTLGHLDTLGEMIDQVIEVNAILSERFEVTFQPFNLTNSLHNLLRELQPRVEAQGLKLIKTLNPKTIWLNGDQVHLEQAFVHIIKNAYNYTLEGGWIEVGLDVDARDVIITVADSGVGIDPDEIDKVFEKLYRGRSADAGPTDTRGMGLGLYISKQIVETHHGKIRLQSQPGLGTLVTIRLPKRLIEPRP